MPKEETKVFLKMMTVDEVLEAAARTQDFFAISSLIAAMDVESLISPDGKFYAQSLLWRAKGRDCYQTVQNIVGDIESIAEDPE